MLGLLVEHVDRLTDDLFRRTGRYFSIVLSVFKLAGLA